MGNCSKCLTEAELQLGAASLAFTAVCDRPLPSLELSKRIKGGNFVVNPSSLEDSIMCAAVRMSMLIEIFSVHSIEQQTFQIQSFSRGRR